MVERRQQFPVMFLFFLLPSVTNTARMGKFGLPCSVRISGLLSQISPLKLLSVHVGTLRSSRTSGHVVAKDFVLACHHNHNIRINAFLFDIIDYSDVTLLFSTSIIIKATVTVSL